MACSQESTGSIEGPPEDGGHQVVAVPTLVVSWYSLSALRNLDTKKVGWTSPQHTREQNICVREMREKEKKKKRNDQNCIQWPQD